LEGNPDRTEGVWVVFRKSKSALEGPTYMDLVDEALCFGWIDSVEKSVDSDRLIQWYSPRRRGGIWSALTKQRIERLESGNLMHDRGRAAIEEAKADGSWAQYDDVEALVVHDDLAEALDATPGAREAFQALPPSHRKQHLWHVYEAKRPETRERRIEATVRRLLE
jgi:uncharacterized protein YdeI (YjbR/CyaY-like superfamily)